MGYDVMVIASTSRQGVTQDKCWSVLLLRVLEALKYRIFQIPNSEAQNLVFVLLKWIEGVFIPIHLYPFPKDGYIFCLD
jgi:hypothetical protein